MNFEEFEFDTIQVLNLLNREKLPLNPVANNRQLVTELIYRHSMAICDHIDVFFVYIANPAGSQLSG